ncbi:MAG: phosphoribosylanthranilate isomerase [Acidimicrobiia bacterium]
MTTEDDALLAVALGADAVGFVFAPSPRRVHPEVVRDIVKRLPTEVVTVGVFRNERPEQVVEVVGRCGLRGAQLHGGEPVSDVRFVRQRVPFLIRALPAGDARLGEVLTGRDAPDVILLDAPEPGSGTVFDWSLAEGAPDGVRLMLAGGLNPDNVEQAIRKVRPWGVDSASGVEAAPGRKDPARMRRFVETAKRVGDELESDWEPTRAAPYDWEEEA